MIRIRPATTADAPAIAGLCAELGYPSTSEQISSRLAQLASRADHAVLVAESVGSVVACMQVSIHTTIESGSWAEIDGLVVGQKYRRAGIGKMLLAEAASWSRTQSVMNLRVRTNELREGACRFYEREGFTLSKTQRVYGRPV